MVTKLNGNKRNSKKVNKDTFINVRVTAKEKEKYLTEATKLGMALSEFVLYLLRHRKINMIEGGTEIAKAMYNLNDTLNKCVLYPHIPVKNIEQSISVDLNRMNKFLNSDREEC